MQAEARNRESFWVSYLCGSYPSNKSSFAPFSDTSAGSWMGTGVAGTPVSTLVCDALSAGGGLTVYATKTALKQHRDDIPRLMPWNSMLMINVQHRILYGHRFISQMRCLLSSSLLIAWEISRRRNKALGPCTHMGNPAETAASWLQISLAPLAKTI